MIRELCVCVRRHKKIPFFGRAFFIMPRGRGTSCLDATPRKKRYFLGHPRRRLPGKKSILGKMTTNIRKTKELRKVLLVSFLNLCWTATGGGVYLSSFLRGRVNQNFLWHFATPSRFFSYISQQLRGGEESRICKTSRTMPPPFLEGPIVGMGGGRIKKPTPFLSLSSRDAFFFSAQHGTLRRGGGWGEEGEEGFIFAHGRIFLLAPLRNSSIWHKKNPFYFG